MNSSVYSDVGVCVDGHVITRARAQLSRVSKVSHKPASESAAPRHVPWPPPVASVGIRSVQKVRSRASAAMHVDFKKADTRPLHTPTTTASGRSSDSNSDDDGNDGRNGNSNGNVHGDASCTTPC